MGECHHASAIQIPRSFARERYASNLFVRKAVEFMMQTARSMSGQILMEARNERTVAGGLEIVWEERIAGSSQMDHAGDIQDAHGVKPLISSLQIGAGVEYGAGGDEKSIVVSPVCGEISCDFANECEEAHVSSFQR